MKKSICIIVLSPVYVLVFVSCECERYFTEEGDEVETASEGQINLSPLKLTVNVNVNAATCADIDTKNYIIRTYNRDNGDKLVQEWKYSETPKIFSLKVGNYTVTASSHDALSAEFEHPYYYGKEGFEILKDQITDTIDPQCALRSVTVTVEYGEKLLTLSGNDVRANVTLGQSPLDFVKDETRAGYYQAINGNTDVITTRLTGTVKGESMDISKRFPQAKVGAHKVTRYTLKDVNENGSSEGGNMDINIRIDVTCTTAERGIIADPDEDIVPDESDRPDNPDNPSGEQPTIKGDESNISKAIVLPETTSPDNPYPVVVNTAAVNGIANLKVTIDSDVLGEDALADVGLKKDFDLAHPEELEDALEGLDFPVGEDVAGKTELVSNITKLTGLLTMLDPGTHNFIITVVDTKNNKTTETLTLVWSN